MKGHQLSDKHARKIFEESGISQEVADARGYWTAEKRSELSELGFPPSQCLAPALVLPLYAPDGTNGLYQIRPDNPRKRKGKGGSEKVVKYEYPAGSQMRIDCPPVCRSMMGDPSLPLWITEGIPKGDALASHGLAAIALLGVWNFKGKNQLGGVQTLADLDSIAWNGRDVRIVFDSDVVDKPEVRKAMERLTEIVHRREAHVTVVYLPPGQDREKVGVDDFLRTHSVQDLESLATVPRPEPKPAQPVVELLDEAPATLRRPLQIINDRAYAVTWCHTKTTVSETIDRSGNIVRHDPPIQTTERQMFVLSDYRQLYGSGCEKSLKDLAFDVRLNEPVREGLCMNSSAIKQFRSNRTRDVVEVFSELVEVFDRFLDFDGSIADQRTMCQLAACFALATWYLDAFSIAGYIYPTGPAGSGKTQFLMLMCMVAHLGEFVQASGSFAAIRDASDYGAFLGFDDAENVTSYKFDPDKRNILLSGTTRGSQVTLKEPDPSGRGWVTRYVDTYAFRGFSAIRAPDNTLGSRTITIPLVRTTNKTKGDADPQDENLWRTPLKRLRGDLWQVALKHLVEMRSFERKAKQSATLTARALQPWTGVLAVAAFLDSRKEGLDLFKRMDALSVKYQNDRAGLETADISRLVLRAIVYCIVPGAAEPFSLEQIIRSANTREWLITTAQITEKCRDLIDAEELDFDLEQINSRRIGRAIGKLRIPKKSNGKRRGWQIHAEGLGKHLKSHSLLTSPDVSDVIYRVDVNNEGTCDHPETSELPTDIEKYASATHSLNVSTVNNVNKVNPVASCEHCMRFTATIGTLCPNCIEVITDPLGEILTSEERTIIDAERDAVSREGCGLL